MAVTVEGLVKGSVLLHLGNSPNSMIQSIVHMTMGTGNLRIKHGRCPIAVIGGELHSKGGEGDDGISRNLMKDPLSPWIPLKPFPP